MIHRIWLAFAAALLLTGCGRGSEDFTVRVARPAERVKSVLNSAELVSAVTRVFPNLKVNRSEPGENEVLFTVPGDGSFPAAIHFTYEPVAGGKETIVHAAIDVPSVKVTLEGKTKVISEYRVQKALHELVQKVGSKLEEGGDTAAERREFSEVLTALAVATDSKKLDRALALASSPNWSMDGFDSIYDGEGMPNDMPASHPMGNQPVGTDPGAAVRQREEREREQMEEASAPMNEARGETPRGESAAGSSTYPGR